MEFECNYNGLLFREWINNKSSYDKFNTKDNYTLELNHICNLCMLYCSTKEDKILKIIDKQLITSDGSNIHQKILYDTFYEIARWTETTLHFSFKKFCDTFYHKKYECENNLFYWNKNNENSIDYSIIVDMTICAKKTFCSEYIEEEKENDKLNRTKIIKDDIIKILNDIMVGNTNTVFFYYGCAESDKKLHARLYIDGPYTCRNRNK